MPRRSALVLAILCALALPACVQGGPESCGGQLSCHWELFCGGFATECEERAGDDCETQPGCTVDD